MCQTLARMHGRGWEGAAPESDAVDRVSVPRLLLFFLFFFSDSRRLGSICTDAARFTQNWANSSRIRPYRIISTGDQYGQNRPKTAEIGLETHRSSRNSDLRCVSCLLLSLFYESSILICFLRIF